ncbi:MAG TPA: hypothetical protein VEH04_19015 [Verrucomicrobiae bacterium]|nr:hypothetical protein [Verrucomicrobiae bacterium]
MHSPTSMDKHSTPSVILNARGLIAPPVRAFFAALLLLTLGDVVSRAHAAPVTFWFQGTVNNIRNPSNSLPAGVALGTPFSGRVTYDPARVGQSLFVSFPAGDVLDAYFTNTSDFSMLVQIGGHTITNASHFSHTTCGYVGVYNEFNNNDSLTIESGSSDIIVDGVSTRIGMVVPTLTLYFSDPSKTAYDAAALPITPPVLSQFANARTFSWMTRLDNGIGTEVFVVGGEIDVISTNALVYLNMRAAANNSIQLGWPAAISGFTLQSRTNLSVGTWQNVAGLPVFAGMEQTMTVPAAQGSRFFRLFAQ